MKLIFAVMYNSIDVFNSFRDKLILKYGKIIAESAEYDFNFTNYYEKEFGKNLKKKIIVFEKDISKEEIAKIKKEIGILEGERGSRKINIDPGFVSAGGVFLASDKKGAFKEKIEDIFLHKVIGFSSGKSEVYKHTFADYKQDKILEFFEKLLN